MFHEDLLEFETMQYLNEAGELSATAQIERDGQMFLEMYQWMLKMRKTDEKLLRMQRQGRIGTYAPFSGQEAAQIGSAFALEKTDWMCPSYRDLAAALVHGMPFEQVLHYVKGHLYGGRTPEDVNILPIQIIIAAQTLHATGIAMAAKLKGETTVAVSYCGDGATSEGDFHEALNFAAVYRLPAIFFVQNNQYAISVPLKQQMASKTIAQKAIAYGMHGVQVDGNDVVAVYEVMKEAVARARSGEGPTLIEALTYRFGPHTTSDDPTKYRAAEEAEEWKKKDPLLRMKKWLVREGLWTEEQEAELVAAFEQELDVMIEENEQEVVPGIEESFEYVYGKMNDLLRKQQTETLALTQERAGE